MSTVSGTFTAAGQGGGKPVRMTITIGGVSREINGEAQPMSDGQCKDPVAYAIWQQFNGSGTTSGVITVTAA